MSNTSVNTTYHTDKKGIFSSIKMMLDRRRLGELLVLKGYLTPQELKSVLQTQKLTQKPLGHIVVEMQKISAFQLSNLLFRQKLLHFTAATLFYAASFNGFAKKSHAAGISDVPSRLVLASVDADAINDIRSYPKLFGAKEKRSKNLKAFTKWEQMFDRFDRALSKPSNQGVIKALQNELSSFKSSSVYDMARDVNAMMNKKKYIVDSKNWGKSDYWATPIEFMARGGDCEDFAIAKYAALRALGVPENRMRIAIVQDEIKNMPHAILIVYSEKGPMVLDNQIKEMRSAKRISHYKPIYSINRTAWWLHTKPTGRETTVIASAK